MGGCQCYEYMKVLFLGKQGSDGCSWYRMTQFKESGVADVQFLNDKMSEEELYQIFKVADVLVTRLGEHTIDIFKGLKDIKKPIIVDIDDRYDLINPYSDSYMALGTEEIKLSDGRYLWKDKTANFDIEQNKKKLESFEEVMRRASAMIVTTFELKNYAEQFNKVVAVIPNAINCDLFPQVKDTKKNNEIRMLWAGGSSHFADLAEVRDVLERLMNKYLNLHFYFIGVPFEGIVKNMSKDRVHTFSWIDPRGHGYRLACMNADIGICPIQDTIFNRAKSSVKYYEYSALRMATVARDIPPYSDDIKHDHTGMLYNDNNEMFKYLSELIEDPIKRLSIANNAYDYVNRNRNINDISKDWATFLKGVSDEYRNNNNKV